MLQEGILFVTNDKFLGHSDLEDFFIDDISGELQRTIRENLQANIQIMLPRMLKDVQVGRPGKYTSMDITVFSVSCRNFPMSASIHSE